MNRLRIFLVVGPLIFFVWALFAGAGEWMSAPYLLLFLVITYMAGAIPALLTCLVDHSLSDKVGDFKRAGITALAGYIIVAATTAVYFQRVDLGIAAISIVGGVAGLICSLLSMRTT